MSDRRIAVLPGGKAVLAENGPLRLVIQACSGSVSEIGLAKEAAKYAFECLSRVAAVQQFLRKRHGLIDSSLQDEIARNMLESVRSIGNEDLTPMAAVAGTIADFVADWLFARDMTRVIVDNGGDIAIRLKPGESVHVGLRPVIESQEISHTIVLDSRFSSWGVATSGLGGRSLTRGIASAVTVFGASASIADAAATAIANGCFYEDKNILQVPAITIDPHTDLGDMLVTISVLGLTENTVRKALERGMKKATDIQERELIFGALIVVGGKFVQTPGFSEFVAEICR